MQDFPGAGRKHRPLEERGMAARVIIYGTETCPFCQKAREAYGDRAVFYNVADNPEKLKEMLVYSKGEHTVPVIVEAGKITVGYGGT